MDQARAEMGHKQRQSGLSGFQRSFVSSSSSAAGGGDDGGGSSAGGAPVKYGFLDSSGNALRKKSPEERSHDQAAQMMRVQQAQAAKMYQAQQMQQSIAQQAIQAAHMIAQRNAANAANVANAGYAGNAGQGQAPAKRSRWG